MPRFRKRNISGKLPSEEEIEGIVAKYLAPRRRARRPGQAPPARRATVTEDLPEPATATDCDSELDALDALVDAFDGLDSCEPCSSGPGWEERKRRQREAWDKGRQASVELRIASADRVGKMHAVLCSAVAATVQAALQEAVSAHPCNVAGDCTTRNVRSSTFRSRCSTSTMLWH